MGNCRVKKVKEKLAFLNFKKAKKIPTEVLSKKATEILLEISNAIGEFKFYTKPIGCFNNVALLKEKDHPFSVADSAPYQNLPLLIRLFVGSNYSHKCMVHFLGINCWPEIYSYLKLFYNTRDLDTFVIDPKQQNIFWGPILCFWRKKRKNC